jgi:ribonuclease G
VLKINLEAVTEVVRQIRLRDLGGIIIIDFIDMEEREHREQVYKAVKRALAEDKARTNVLQISELGLVEMTRKRVRQDLRALLTQHCPTCRGTGVVKSNETLATEIYRRCRPGPRPRRCLGEGREIVARVNPTRRLSARRRSGGSERLEAALEVKIAVQAAPGLAQRGIRELLVR